MAAAVTPGWYGKLPRWRLREPSAAAAVRRAVDHWLADGLAAWRDSDPDWLEAFLAAPTWRFVLGAGVPFKQSPAMPAC
jgi:hypothetical protein